MYCTATILEYVWAKYLDETNAVRNIEGILVRGQADESFFLAIRADESVSKELQPGE